MSGADKPQVFLSYAHDDLVTVRKLFAALEERKVNVWFDKVHLGPGKWLPQISKAIAKSRYFVFCMSAAALRKIGDSAGFVDTELQKAYDIAMAQDEARFTIIPLRLEEELSHGDHRLSIFQQYDLFDDWDGEVDRLAAHLGGEPLASRVTEEAQSEEEQLLQSVLAKAVTAYVNKHYDDALPLIEKAVTLKPGDADAWYVKGVTLGHLGRHEDALRALDQALALNDTHALASVNKATVLFMLGRYEEAVTAHERAAVLDPGNFIPWVGKGLALEQLGRTEASLEAFEKALAINPDDGISWSGKGRALAARDRHEAAQRAFQVAVERLPQDSAVWVARAKSLIKLDRNEEALKNFEKALTISPDDSHAWAARAGYCSICSDTRTPWRRTRGLWRSSRGLLTHGCGRAAR